MASASPWRQVPVLTVALLQVVAINPPFSAASVRQEQPPLKGTSLQCCTVPEPPLVIENAESASGSFLGYDGIALSYLQLLQNRTGMECSSLIKYDPDSVNGIADSELEGDAAQVSGGNEFDNFIGKLTQCTVINEQGEGVINRTDETCTCDLGVGGWALNEKRLGLVDFLPPYVFDSFYVVTHIDNTIPDAGVFFLRTFNKSVWGTIFALLIIFALLKYMDSGFAPWTKKDDDLRTDASGLKRWQHYLLKGRLPYRLRKSLQSTMGHMMGVPSSDIDGEFGSFRQNFLNFIIFLCGLFLVLIYGSSMTASIVQDSFGSAYRDVNDFKLCRIPTQEVCLLGGDGVEQYWNFSIAKAECHREEGFLRPRVFSSEDSIPALEAAANKECTFLVGLGSTMRYEINRFYCGKLVLTGQPFFHSGVSFVLPRKSNLTMPLSRATLALKNEDVVRTIFDFFDDDDDEEECLLKQPKSLTFSKLRWFFYLAFAACFALFLGMALAGRGLERRRDQETGQEPKDEESGFGPEARVEVGSATEDETLSIS